MDLNVIKGFNYKDIFNFFLCIILFCFGRFIKYVKDFFNVGILYNGDYFIGIVNYLEEK